MYLLPTKRGWLLIFFVLFTLIVDLIRPNLLLALCCAGGTGILMTTFLMTLFSGIGIRIKRLPTQDGQRGCLIHLPLEIKNILPLPRMEMVIRENIPFTAETMQSFILPPLSPHQHMVLDRFVLPVHRGEFILTKIFLRSGDPLGLFYLQRSYFQEQKIIIFPAMEPISWLPLGRKINLPHYAHRISRIPSCNLDFYGIREYRSYDNVRAIDWKATARHRQLMVREYEENTAHQITIILDVNKKYITPESIESNFEYLIKLAASLVNYLASVHCHLCFCAGTQWEESAFSGISSSCKTKILSFLTTLRPQPLPIADLLEFVSGELYINDILYCLTMEDSPQFDSLFGVLIERGIDLRWVYAPPSLFSPSMDISSSSSFRSHQISTRVVEPFIVHPRISILDALMLPQLSYSHTTLKKPETPSYTSTS